VTEAMLSALEALSDGILGETILPFSEDYDGARALWNGSHDHMPHAIVRPRCAADVAAALAYAREQWLPVAVRGGGHHVAGYGSVEEGLTIDLSLMRGTWVDREQRTVHVHGGALWSDVDRATQAYGLAVPGGTISSVGVGGFTLGGGIGHLSRAHGLAADNLVSVELVTAEGRVVTASEHSHKDLFWALRGGGGNFGVATSFEFRLHGVGPDLWAGPLAYRIDDAPKVLRVVRDLLAWAPRELGVSAAIVQIDGRPALGLNVVWTSDPAAAGSAVRPLREAATPIADFYAPNTYVEFQSASDGLVPPGRRATETSTFLGELSDETIDRLVQLGASADPGTTRVALLPLSGAIADVPAAATAFGGRGAGWLVAASASWDDPGEDAARHRWVDRLHAASAADTIGHGYVNMLADDRPAYTSWTRAKLRSVKGAWDPENLFRSNHNISPLG
jgi:FAD/FMN-containing dehydrogenase